MALWGSIFGKSLVTAFLLGCLTTSAWGQRSELGLVPFGEGFNRLTEFTGQVICVGCGIEEARERHPQLFNLYQLNHGKERIVMQIESFTDSSDRHYWQSVAGLADEVAVRGADPIVGELTAEENRFKELTVTGILHSTRTLDIESVRVEG